MEQTPQSATSPSDAAQSLDGIAWQKKLAEAEASIVAAASQADEYLKGWQRAKADYQNLKRESEQRSWQEAKVGVKSVVGNLWTHFYGDLELALQHVPEEHAEQPWVVGVRNGIKQFIVILKKLGFEAFSPATGQPFNYLEHEAVEAVENSGQRVNTITAVVRSGLRYVDDGDVVVTARVKVAK